MASQTRTATPAPVSLRPSAFAAGGGLVDDADLTIDTARFIMTDYGGKSDSGEVMVLQLKLKGDDDTEYEQLYSCGNGFVPAETGDEATNGTFMVPVGDKTAPSGSSNFAVFMNSLVNAGFPEDKLDSGLISELDGLKGHFNRVPAPKRSNLPQRTGANADRQQTVLILATLISLPGDPAPAKANGKSNGKVTPIAAKAAAGKAPAKAAVAPVEVEADPLVAELADQLMNVFLTKDVQEMKKVELVPSLFKSIEKTDPNRQKLMSLAGKEEILASLEGFSYEKGVLSLG